MGEQFADQTDAAAVADYVAAMSADLSAMAKRSGFDLLGYLLDMGQLEAESAGRQTKRGNAR